MSLKWIPRSKWGTSKSRPCWVAHTCIDIVWVPPPPLPPDFPFPFSASCKPQSLKLIIRLMRLLKIMNNGGLLCAFKECIELVATRKLKSYKQPEQGVWRLWSDDRERWRPFYSYKGKQDFFVSKNWIYPQEEYFTLPDHPRVGMWQAALDELSLQIQSFSPPWCSLPEATILLVSTKKGMESRSTRSEECTGYPRCLNFLVWSYFVRLTVSPGCRTLLPRSYPLSTFAIKL